MKTFRLFAAVAAIAFLASCSAKMEEPEVSVSGDQVTITANAPEDFVPASKVSLNSSSGDLFWQNGDQIAVWTSSDSFKQFTLSAGAGTVEGSFTGTLGTGETLGDVAVSPYSVSPTYDGSTISLTLPNSYQWKKDKADAVMIATGASGGVYSFVHAAGVVAVTYNNVPYTATRFRFTADKNITGACTVSSGQINSAAGGKYVDYTFEIEETTKMTFFVPVPAQSYNSFSVALYDEDDNLIFGSDKASSTTVEISRGELNIIPAITLQSSHLKGQWKFENASNLLKATVGPDLKLSAGSLTARTDGPSAHNHGCRTTTAGYMYAEHGITGNNWTISMYIRPVNVQDNPLIHVNTGASVDAQLAITNVSQFAITQAGYTSGQLITPGYMGFNHIDVVNDGGIVSIYLNYIKVKEYDDSSTNYFTMTEGKTTFFADNTAMVGDIDVFDLAIWDTALSRDELLAYAGLKAPDKSSWTVSSNSAGGTWTTDWDTKIINDNGAEFIQYNGATENLWVNIDMQEKHDIGFISLWTGTPWGNTGQKYTYIYYSENGTSGYKSLGFISKPTASRNNGLVHALDLTESKTSNTRYLHVVVNPSDVYNTTYIMMAEVSVFYKLY